MTKDLKKSKVELDNLKRENKKLKKKLSRYQSKEKKTKQKKLIRKSKKSRGISPQPAATPGFKGKNKDKAKTHFDRAMKAIVGQDYATAKYQLEKVLNLQPRNKMTLDIMEDVNLILQNKK